MKLTLEARPEYVLPHPDFAGVDHGQIGGDVVLTVGRRWVRFAAYAGTPPGSNIGWWVTRGGYTGELFGINYRVGRRYVGPCLTLFIHTRRREAQP